ncbi:hypothetical protein JW887_06240 [Candidatus Dojkabacteria bacterium]|nr:hypothetical protein [Candidatus Dojkabacteria bacterium]
MKKVNLSLKIFILVLLVLAISLYVYFVEKNQPQNVTFEYQITQCSNPWDNVDEISNDSIEDKVESYLSEEKIDYIDFTIQSKDSEFISCEACTCETGETLRITFKDIEDMEDFASKFEKTN